MSASSTAVTERLEKVENRLSEWEATTRCRVKGATLLLQEGRTLGSGSKEFWRLKEKVAPLLQEAVKSALDVLPPTDIPDGMINELGQVLFKDSLIGIFPVGGGEIFHRRHCGHPH